MEHTTQYLIGAVIASITAREIIIRELRKYGFRKRTMYANHARIDRPHIILFWGIIWLTAAPTIIIGRILGWNPKTTDD
jgi:hypothetical protein